MKNIKYAAAAIALSALSFGAFAAQPVTSAQAESMNKIGVVSAEGATTLDGLEAKLAEVLAAANARAEKINALETVTIASKAGDEGKLFGSIGTRDIADAVTAAGVKVAKSEVRLPNGVLRNVGEHEVDFQVHSEVFAKVIINVVAE